MKITDELLDHIANLARLEVNETEREQLKADMNSILDWVDKLDEVNTDSVEPLIHMSTEINKVRDDKNPLNLSHENAMKNAPGSKKGYYVVPKVIDKGK